VEKKRRGKKDVLLSKHSSLSSNYYAQIQAVRSIPSVDAESNKNIMR
jgi:hypothetical protein